MPEKSHYEADFEKYLRHTGADKKEKTFAWATAIGLQQVDGLKPSEYLYQTAKRNIEGEISFDDVSRLINSYYKNKSFRLQNADNRTEEADKVSSRIAQILSEPSFNFSPSYLIAVHKRLFEGIFKFAGRLRDYDITKNEWVLNGDTVMYGAALRPITTSLRRTAGISETRLSGRTTPISRKEFPKIPFFSKNFSGTFF